MDQTNAREFANAIAAKVSKEGAISMLILGEVAKRGSVEAGLDAVLGNVWRVELSRAGIAIDPAAILETVIRNAADEIAAAARRISGRA